MLRTTLNLGILAHVDAGKTTLSERLLYHAGVIDEVGRVDSGTTQTDSLALERHRGITIRSAVVSLTIGGTPVNLIDTPGHPDFIAEVDRILGVLDGAVLVISAVEGVQPQTRVLLRALQRVGVPALLFVNKTDRRGADVDRVLREIRGRLALTTVPAGASRATLIEALADRDEALLADFVTDDPTITTDRLRVELIRQTRAGQVYPVFAGSAATGAGVDALMTGIIELLPRVSGETEGPPSGRIFKIERGAAGEKVAYVRMFSGTVRTRDRLDPHADDPRGDKISAINVFHRGAWVRRAEVSAGDIGKLWGLTHVQVGDVVGRPRPGTQRSQFPPPTLEAVAEPVHREDHVRLRSALAELAEQDPLINVRDLAVSLYGEVQKEVIAATLEADYGIEIRFLETTPLHIERPVGIGEALEVLNAESNPFHAAVGLRVEPGPHGSGHDFRLAVDFRSVPLYVYRNLEDFGSSMETYVRDTLREGLRGWPVHDCIVTMTHSNYSLADGPPSRRGPLSTAADFRKLTPMVLMKALEKAGTRVCQPMVRARIDAPAASMGSLLGALGSLGASVVSEQIRGDEVTIEAVLPAADVAGLHRMLPSLTSGEGVLEFGLAGYQAVRATPPVRDRTTANPLNRQEYLATAQRSAACPAK